MDKKKKDLIVNIFCIVAILVMLSCLGIMVAWRISVCGSDIACIVTRP